MLISTQASVKMPDSVSRYFAMSLGIKQGDPISPTLFNIFINDLVEDINSLGFDFPDLNNVPIPLLLYADDVVLFSESPKGLQSSLDILNSYCTRWKLNVNMKKTKILIFENRKSAAPLFLLGNRVLSRVDRYKYLGVIFYLTGYFKNAREELYLKAIKALFGVNNKIYLNNFNPVLAKKLFNTLVKPIITYGSEVWGAELLNTFNKDIQQLDKLYCEKLQNKFCKIALGVHKKSINCAVRKELDCNPLTIEIFCNMFKYEQRLINIDHDRVVFHAYREEINFHLEHPNSWIHAINRLKDLSGSNDLVTIRRYLLNTYSNKLTNFINNSQRLKFYKIFYQHDTMPNYLSIKSPSLRKAFTKFRISSHKLGVLIQKYTKNPADGICSLCGTVEDETHVLLDCPKHNIVRNMMISKIEFTLEYDFDLLSTQNKIKLLMTPLSVENSREVALFLKIISKEKD